RRRRPPPDGWFRGRDRDDAAVPDEAPRLRRGRRAIRSASRRQPLEAQHLERRLPDPAVHPSHLQGLQALAFFSGLASLLALGSLVIGSAPIDDYLRARYVLHVPPAI